MPRISPPSVEVAVADKTEQPESVTTTDAETRHGLDRSYQLIAEVERLAHNLNVHLDEIHELITERRQEL